MAKIRFALGAEADLVTSGELEDSLSAMRKGIAADLGVNNKPKRIFRPLSAAMSVPSMVANDQFAVHLGTPASGRVWVITRLTVIGDNDHQTVTNLAASLYIGQGAGPSPNANEVTQFQCVLHGNQIPFTYTQNEHAWTAHDRESVTVLLRAFGAVTPTDIYITGQAYEYRDCDIESQMI